MIDFGAILGFSINLLIFLSILSVLIVVHEFGHFIVAKRTGVRVETFSLGFGKVLFSRKKNGTQYCISAIPLGGYVKMAGDNVEEYKGESDEYLSKPAWKRFSIVFFGPLLNYVLAFLIFWLIFFMGYPSLTTRVDSLLEGFGAQEAGLKAGDKIIAVDARKVVFWEELQAIIHKKKISDKVKLSVLRDNTELDFVCVIKEKLVEDNTGAKHGVGLIGITPRVENAKGDIVRSLTLGVHSTWSFTLAVVNGLSYMITGKLSVRESVTGPIGIFIITAKVANYGLVALLHLVAVLSLSLAIFNLFPFPVLDGGNILFILLEKIRGKPLNIKLERIINQVGMSVLIFLVVIVSYNDIIRFFGDRIIKILGR